MSNRIRGPRDKHPSGKPIHRDNRRSYGDGYANREEPKVVSLRSRGKVEAIGFTAHLVCEDDYE